MELFKTAVCVVLELLMTRAAHYDEDSSDTRLYNCVCVSLCVRPQSLFEQRNSVQDQVLTTAAVMSVLCVFPLFQHLMCTCVSNVCVSVCETCFSMCLCEYVWSPAGSRQINLLQLLSEAAGSH